MVETSGDAYPASVTTGLGDMSYGEAQGLAVQRVDAARAVQAAERAIVKATEQLAGAKEALVQARADQKELG